MPSGEDSAKPVRPVCPMEAADDDVGEAEHEEMTEGREVASRTSPKAPSAEERRMHNITHIPFRSWCPHCVAARGKNFPHLRSSEVKEDEFPCVHLDYCFMRDEAGGESVPVLVSRYSDSKSLAAHVVPHKGTSTEWAVGQVCRDLRKFGIAGTVSLRSDQEPALVALLKEVAKVRDQSGLKTIIEHSPVAESQANGRAEQAVQATEGIVRTMKLDLEEKLGCKVPVSCPAFSWLVEHSVDVTNKCHVFIDGKTSFERVKGRKHRGELHEFGMQVLHRIPGKPQGGLMEARWIPGTWLGKRYATEEHIVATADGRVVKSRAIRPVESQDKWNKEKVLGVKGTPWNPSGEEKSEVEVKFDTPMARPEARMRPSDAMDEMENAPRSTAITSRHLEKVGYTGAGCAKCRAMLAGDEYQPRGHSAVCRARVYKALRADEELRGDMDRADERKQRYLKRKAEDQEEGRDPEHRERGEDEIVAEDMQEDGGNANGEMAMDDSATVPTASSSSSSEPSSSSSGGVKREREGKDEEEEQRPTAYQQTGDDAGDSDATEDRNVLEWRPRGEALGSMEENKSKHEEYDVCEAFSRPRTAARARERGMKGGWSLDLNFTDPCTGRRWDLSEDGDQKKCMTLLHRTRPKLLTVSCPCTLFSALQALSGGVKDPVAMAKAIKMVEFGVRLCEAQHRAGRLFTFEHPTSATSWRLPCVKRLMSLGGIYAAVLDMCQFGMMQEDHLGPGHVKKSTRILSNSSAIDGLIEKRCQGEHRHIPLLNGRAKWAAEYPQALCDAFLDGLIMEKQAKVERELNVLNELSDMCDKQEEKDWNESLEKAYDDLTGEELDPKLVKEAREEEMKGFKDFGVYEYVLRETARSDPTGKKIGVRWVDVNKGTSDRPKVRSRLVGQEFAGKEIREDLFAATPPMSATRTLLSLAASQKGTEKSAKRLMVLDVKKAFLYGRIKRTVFIELPPEDPMAADKQYVGRLLKAMYGTRDAPAVWQQEVRQTMAELGFKPCLATPCLYVNEETGVMVVAHVDDMLCTGDEKELEDLRKKISAKYEIKSTMLGPGSSSEKECRFLGRHIRWTGEGLEWEGDEKLRDTLLQEWDMKNASAVCSPYVKEECEAEGGQPMNSSEASRYRRAAAQVNYLSLDNPQISYAAKELSRKMASPQIGDEVKLKRVLRYLVGCPRTVYKYPWQHEVKSIVTYTDSDWAGDASTRRSTSGGVLFLGAHLVSHWSRTQQTIALSSGEAELNASLKGACESLGERVMLEELGKKVEIAMYGDSSASQGTIQRQGAGRMKHLSVKQLWIQERVANKEIDTFKIPRAMNCADCLTHAWTSADVKHFRRMGILTPAAKAPI